MKDIKNIFRNLEKQMKNASWFEDDWEIYNRGEYLQLYKGSWFNHNQNGIHFETYIEAPQIKQKSFPICLHAEDDCPSQKDFVEKFLQLESERINSWKGYRTSGTGYTICERILPLNFKNLEQRLLSEFNLLRQLEKGIEQTLSMFKT